MTPAEAIAEGNVFLGAVLSPAGFSPGPTRSGQGSGGDFATTCWSRGDQAIEISFRYSLGMVMYRWGAESFDHKTVAGALGVAASYPGFSSDPLDGFRHLADDLQGPLAPLLLADTSDVLARVRNWQPATLP